MEVLEGGRFLMSEVPPQGFHKVALPRNLHTRSERERLVPAQTRVSAAGLDSAVFPQLLHKKKEARGQASLKSTPPQEVNTSKPPTEQVVAAMMARLLTQRESDWYQLE